MFVYHTCGSSWYCLIVSVCLLLFFLRRNKLFGKKSGTLLLPESQPGVCVPELWKGWDERKKEREGMDAAPFFFALFPLLWQDSGQQLLFFCQAFLNVLPNHQRWDVKRKLSWSTQVHNCIHVFGRLAPNCILCLLTTFLHRSSVGSLLRVRCWLGVQTLLSLRLPDAWKKFVYAQSVLFNKISTSQLSRKRIRIGLLVGYYLSLSFFCGQHQ